MRCLVLALPLLFALPNAARAELGGHVAGVSHASGLAADKGTGERDGDGVPARAPTPRTTRAGQGDFARVAEVVRVLDANPSAHGSAVELEALRPRRINVDVVTGRCALGDLASAAKIASSRVARRSAAPRLRA